MPDKYHTQKAENITARLRLRVVQLGRVQYNIGKQNCLAQVQPEKVGELLASSSFHH